MTKIEPEYVSYQKRIVNGLGRIFISSLFFGVLLFVSGIDKYYIATLMFLFILFLINYLSLGKHSKKYLKSILITEKFIEINVVEMDRELKAISTDLENVRIKVIELFFGYYGWRRNYKLQIDISKNGKFETLYEQFEIGRWNLKLFKEVYALYSEVKNVPYNLASLK